MKTNIIGRTEVRVTETSFGCASIGNLYRAATDAQVHKVLDTAWASGIRYFDTAPHYGRGRSEQRLGQFLKGKDRGDFAVSTKVGRVLSPGSEMAKVDGFVDPLPNSVRYDYSGDGIEESLEHSFGLLDLSYVDIAFVHDIGSYTHGADNARHMAAFFDSGYERLIRLKEQGRIGAFGLGVNENQACLDVMAHGPVDVILLAGRLTLLERSAEEVLVGKCRAAGTSLVLGGIFNSGILATGPIEGATYDYAPASVEILSQVVSLQDRAASIGLPIATAALHFAKRHPLVASILLGTASPRSLTRNLQALEMTMPAEFDAAFSHLT